MGVYIEGMEMPKSCYNCILICDDGDYPMFRVTGEQRGYNFPTREKRMDRCPLVPVPPHGRLIDADKQDAQIEALIERHLHGYTKSTWDFVCELRDILKRNRTIIPAEEGKT